MAQLVKKVQEVNRKAGVLVALGLVSASAFAQSGTYSTITTADAQLITDGITANLSVIIPVILALLGVTVGVMWGVRKLRQMGNSA